MEGLVFFFNPIGWLILFAISFYCTGKSLLVLLFKIPQLSASFFFSSVMGMCFVILGSFFLLLFNILNTTNALILILAPVLLAFWLKPTIFILHWKDDVIRKHYALIALLLAFWFSVAIRVFLPESGVDALSYHLPYAKSFATEGGLVLEKYLRYPLNTLNFNLLFTLGFLFEGETLARMFSLYAAFLLVIGTYTFGLKFFNAYVATVAAWVFISSQIILNIMNTAFIDIGFALFVFAAVFALMTGKNEHNENWFFVVAVFLGIMMGTKYLGLLVAPSILCWMLFVIKEKKTWTGCVLLMLIVASPWYIRSQLVSGNPIHPFAQSWFGYWLWTPTDMIHQNNDLFRVHGVERNWVNLIKLPWLIYQNSFVRIAPTNDLIVIAIPLMLVGLTKPGLIRQFSLFSLFHVVFWFYSSQIMRYLIFALPFLSLIAAYYITQFLHFLFSHIPKPVRLKSHITSTKQHILGGVFVAITLASSIKYHHKVISKNMIPTSQRQWQQILNQKPEYQLVNAANLQGGKSTMKLGFPYVAHYFKYPFKGDYFGAANMTEFSRSATSDNKVLAQMQELGTEMLLIDNMQKSYVKIHQILQYSDKFELLFENTNGYLYKVK